MQVEAVWLSWWATQPCGVYNYYLLSSLVHSYFSMGYLYDIVELLVRFSLG
jgi:hypothetical protein